jgi:uncharacterized protein YigA (DUF484 family)
MLSRSCLPWLQELGLARSDALTKHLDLLRAEKEALTQQLRQLCGDNERLQEDVLAAERRCDAAEANADAVSRVRCSDIDLSGAESMLTFRVWALGPIYMQMRRRRGQRRRNQPGALLC